MQTLTLFMLLRSQPAWLRLSRQARQDFIAAEVAPILARYPAVTLRFFDAEAFTSRCTDVAVWTAQDLKSWSFLMDALRDTAFFSAPYYEVVDIIPALENAYAEYDAEAA
ncbi:hypothetical protein QO010_001752 [Caulobacter ginsengisoli]|uniref:Darcynin 1 n=1 Tax=Caulobacter ginsengisoli TaxID=400775 RepID=A0ABU0IRK0_9CAUL|nr:darcynin family protein [Caulobacter ginsengisoli]MDQ0463981.1 hypothetical protein [Caulobacter ginsengisoli]